MNYKTKIFLQSLFALVAFGVALQATATWVAPIGTPPTGGDTKPPINTSATTQAKDGGIVAWSGLRSGTVLIVDGTSDLKDDVTIASGKKLTINTNGYLFPASQGSAGDFLKVSSVTGGVATLVWGAASGSNPDLSWDSVNHEVDITGGGTSAVVPLANATTNGLVSTGAQTFAGTKTFNGQAIFTSALTQNDPASNFTVSSNVVAFQALSGAGTKCVHADNAGILSLTGADCGAGSGGEANTASNLGGGLANFDSKSGVDLRFNSFTAADFNLASNLISIDYANGQTANTSTKGFLSSADWNTFNGKMTNPMTNLGDIIYGGASGAPTRLASGASGLVLKSNGVGAAPSWQTDATGGAPGFNTITSGTNSSAAMVVSGTASLTASGTGVLKANQFASANSITTAVDLDITTGVKEIAGVLPVGNGGTGVSSVTGGCMLAAETTGTLVEKCPANNDALRRVASGTGWTTFTPVDTSTAQTITGIKTLTNPTLSSIGTTSNAANAYYDTVTSKILRSTSSIRYKKDVADLEIDTSKIYGLKPVSYTSKSDGLRYFGLIAEDVDKVIPALVDYLPEKNVIAGSTSSALIPDSVKYPMLSVLLLKETQKHEAEINELKKENEDLKSRIEALEAKIK